MRKIGLTGGIGTGKTTVGKIFAVLDVPVYSADDRAKWLMSNDAVVRENLIKEFGGEVFSDNGLNRPFLAEIVFSNPNKLKALNSIVHPAVRNDFELWCVNQNSSYVLKEAAILFEAGLNKSLDQVICVSADVESRISRVIGRDGVTKEQVLARINNQMDLSEIEKSSDFVIHNNPGDSLIPQVMEIHNKLRNG
ncbi:MAG: dephospho-CoA kinase [Sphingobacteriales bacterium]|jgi:dephospho-CoA kinase